MSEFEKLNEVRIRLTGESGTIWDIDHSKTNPYLVRIEEGKGILRCVRFEAFHAGELERVEKPAQPPSAGPSGGHANDASRYYKGAWLAPDPPAPSDDWVNISDDLKLIKWRLAEIADAIEKRPTGWQLFWIITLAGLAIIAALQVREAWL
ncbi:hypothetical protein [Martelella soudanensis]|uniref:hypothetical protein n=1 Tax=unclassified Martelella TaxID=2629616 RepID=UPI0015DE5B63|nr:MULTISPECIES: hypothetical protein [unclassified Martelella]